MILCTLRRKRWWLVLLVTMSALLGIGCGRVVVYHPSPLDALADFPGYLDKADPVTLESARILQEEQVADGLVVLYTWQKSDWVDKGLHGLARTFLTHHREGWLAQASGSTTVSTFETFVAAYTAGGNGTPLTTAYGFSNCGTGVRIVWSDGEVSLVSLGENGTFLKSRPDTIRVRRVELLEGEEVITGQDLE